MKMRDESGQTLILVALCLTCLLGFVALAADVGTLSYAKREMQTAADAAAIAGAAELNYGDALTAAQAAAAQNGVTDGTNGAGVTINDGPSYGPHAGDLSYVEAIVTAPQSTLLMGLFTGQKTTSVAARAVATLGNGQNCVYALGSSGTDIGITGNADISAPNCGIVDDSTSSSALKVTGNITLSARSIGVVGGYSSTGNVSVTPTPVEGIPAESNPLAFLKAPKIPSTCSADPSLTGNKTATLTPGCYDGLTAKGNSALTLSPGTYVIDGAITVNGNASVTGEGVTLYLATGGSALTGNITLDLTAPTSGTYNGILFFQAASNTSAFSLTGNSGSTLEGVIYIQNAAVTMNGNSGSNIYADFVVKSLSLVGNSSFQDYATLNGDAPIKAAGLVE